MPHAADLPALVIALLAIGVHVAAALVLLVLDAANPRVRVYVAFLAALVVWFACVAARAAGLDAPGLGLTAALSAHVLPLLYVVYAIPVLPPARRTLAYASVAVLGVVALPASLAPGGPHATLGAYHAVLWTAGAALLAHRARLRRTTGAAPDGAVAGAAAALARGRRRIVFLLSAIAVANVALIVTGHALSLARLVPLAAMLAQALVLVGALRYQLYGVALRAERTGAARTGALAGDAAALERLALLGELGATVAHEVRNPLTGIRSLAQRLAEEGAVDAERRTRFAALIVREVDRLDRFVGSMLDLARREAADGAPDGTAGEPTLEPVAADPRRLTATGAHAIARRAASPGGARTAVAPLLADVELLVAARAARRGVRLALERRVDEVAAAREPLAQVLLNLLLNAIAHSPPDGTVRLVVAPVDAPAGPGAAPDTIALTVLDEGPGLPPDAHDHLFTAFAPHARGTGLGLAVVRRVAEAHGWIVRGENGAAGGARFTVVVPAAHDRAFR